MTKEIELLIRQNVLIDVVIGLLEAEKNGRKIEDYLFNILRDLEASYKE